MYYFPLDHPIPVDQKLIEGVDKNSALTVEQAFQFILKQEIGTVFTYRMVKPCSALDVSWIVQSAIVQNLMALWHFPTEDPYELRIKVVSAKKTE